MAEGAIRWVSWGISPSTLMAFNRTAAEAPNRLLVFPVTMVPSSSSMAAAGAFNAWARSRQGVTHLSILRLYFGLLHKEVQLVDFLGISLILGQMVDGLIIAADDLLVGCFSAGFIVKDAEASHIYTQYRWGIYRAASVDAFKDCIQYRENINITVVVDGCLSIGLQMEGIDHIYIIQISGSCFISQIHRML